MSDPIVERIEREAGVAGARSVLARAPADRPAVAAARGLAAAGRGLEPRDVLRPLGGGLASGRARRGRSRAARRARAPRLRAHAVAVRAPRASPVAPLGTTAVLGRDPAGLGRRDRRAAARSSATHERARARVRAAAPARPPRRGRLCASHRLLRAQPFEPPFQQHFRLLALVSAGRAGAGGARCSRSSSASISACSSRSARPPSTASRASRRTTRARPSACRSRGRELVEGGFVDWTQRLLGDRKERLLVSGIGLDLLSTIAESTRR